MDPVKILDLTLPCAETIIRKPIKKIEKTNLSIYLKFQQSNG
jgi:hypothetical protein